MTGNRVFDAAPIFRAKATPPPVPRAGDPKSAEKVKTSVLDVWEKRIRNMFTMNRSQHVSTMIQSTVSPITD